MQCLMDHIVLNVADIQKMIAFYANVLEMPTDRLDEYNAGEVPFPSVRLNANTIIDLFPRRLWQKDTPVNEGRMNLNHFCIALEKNAWEALLKRLEINGVAVQVGPAPRWGARGTGTSIYFNDPEGNLIEARYYDVQQHSEPCLLGS
jgi:catechol 2,3-dioxygenase-like lactoylglutathione lyase family enzyme